MSNLIPISKPDLGLSEKQYLIDCFDSSWISSSGEYINRFEKEFSKFCGVSYGVAVSNGTVALHLALVALGIGEGDEVIIPDLTFAATVNAVIYTGASPILVDVRKDTWTVDIDKCEEIITKNTKAIIPVHLYGHPCEMKEILEFAGKYKLHIIEDCAEAHGAEYQNRKVGSFGQISCFSFYGNKIITTGEGGMCLTNDKNLMEKMKILRDHGMNKNMKYYHEIIGFNYRMTNMQAAIGCGQVQEINNFIKKRRYIESLYNSFLKDCDLIKMPIEKQYIRKVCWLYTILINISRLKIGIKDIQLELKKANIDSRQVFYPLHEMKPYKNLKKSKLENSIRIHQDGLSLPTYTTLDYNKIKYISFKLKDILKRNLKKG